MQQATQNTNIQLRKFTLAETIAFRNKPEALSFLRSKGYEPKNMIDVVDLLDYYILQHKDTAIAELAQIHPDREMIIENNIVPKHNNANGDEYNNCAGCGGKCGSKAPAFSNVDGAASPVSLINNNQMFYAVIAFAVVGLVVVAIKN